MAAVLLCLPGPEAAVLQAQFAALGEPAVVIPPGTLTTGTLHGARLLVLAADPRLITADLLHACDRAGVRVVPIAADERGAALATANGLQPATATDAAHILAIASQTPTAQAAPNAGAVIAVWGPHGAPGRSTVAASLAVELARLGSALLVDADTCAPSAAAQFGLSDESPGLAGACRQAERGAFDAAEYTRIRDLITADGALAVLVGINRPSRWPELPADRLALVFDVLRRNVQRIVVDVAASVEQDEALLADLADPPTRNAATILALQRADRVLLVAQPDPIGLARAVRASADLRTIAPGAVVTVVVNRLRAGPVGMEPRAQVRRTLERFGGVSDVVFLPDEPASADRALLLAQPIAMVAPRSAFAGAVRRLAAYLDGGLRPEGAEVRLVAPRSRRARRLRQRDELAVQPGAPSP